MTNVKKHSLTSSEKSALTAQLIQFFQGTNGVKVFNNLCTETEQIMLIKRLAIIILLEQKYTNYVVARTLQVSESTVARIDQNRVDGQYKDIIKKINKKSFNEEKFWQILGVLLRGGLPPRVGPGRWKRILK